MGIKDKVIHSVVGFWREWGKPLLFAVIIVAPLRSSIADWYDVPTGSMKPTILEGDRIFVNKLAYDLKFPFTRARIASWDDPQRGEVIVFISPADGARLVKRVIGLPGDEIAMRQNQLYVNGELLRYEPLSDEIISQITPAEQPHHRFYAEQLPGRAHAVMLTPEVPALNTFTTTTVPPGKYFVMGDNRDNSADSRYIGFIDRERILGEATTVVISLDRSHHWQPRWQRFLRAL